MITTSETTSPRRYIKQLPPDLAAKVAAGEVIERPASIVKELLENAIDAGATEIAIDVEEGGQSLIRVQDNGEGIPSSELVLAFSRHATSKMSEVDDLFAVRTLGFRGEALPSIAAVADVEIATRHASESYGSVVTAVQGAHVGTVTPQGLPTGTTVTVRDVFASIPARRKYLKSRSGEVAAVQAVVMHYAMAYPSIRMQLYSDSRIVFSSPGTGALGDVLATLYGPEVTQRLRDVHIVHRDTTIWGLVSPPDLHRPSRTYQSFFVNGRWIRSRLLSVAVEEAYRTHLMVGRHPLCVIHLTLPPSHLDVNVHPTKSEVKFLYDREVFSAVRNAAAAVVQDTMPEPGKVLFGLDLPGEREVQQELLHTNAGPALPSRGDAHHVGGGPTPRLRSDMISVLRVLGQANSLYIIAEGPEGVYMVDQHAAHERVLFDELVEAAGAQRVESQFLLEPIAVELSPAQYSSLEACTDALQPLGFSVEPFGTSAAIIRAVPAVLAAGDPSNVLCALLEQGATGGEVNDWRERSLATIACKSAVKAGQILGIEEMRQLVYRLETTSRPRTCPHGRPTMILLSAHQLEREFGRKG